MHSVGNSTHNTNGSTTIHEANIAGAHRSGHLTRGLEVDRILAWTRAAKHGGHLELWGFILCLHDEYIGLPTQTMLKCVSLN